MAWFSCECTSFLKNDFAEMTLGTSICIVVEMLPDFIVLLGIESFFEC